jgi:predicted acetyltransferase
MSGVELVAAAEADRPVVARLIQLYLHDMTEYLPFAVGEDGLYEYDYLERFWQHPYLLRVDGELAGFALVIDRCPVTGETPCWFVAEFFLMRAYRGRGAGRAAAEAVFGRHAGRWHVGVINRNGPAAAFWSAVLPHAPSRAVHFDGEDWTVREFVR